MSSIGGLHWADFVVIGGYFVLSLAIGFWSICKPKKKESMEGFFLAGRNMVWWPIGMSLFASNIGANNFVGTAGSGANSGFAVIMFEWSAVPLLMLLGWVFLPVYIASGIYTMPEYLQQRFGGQRLRTYLSIIALITYLFATVSADLYTGGIFIQQTMGINIYIGALIMLAVSAVYTSLGGLTTVIFTDALAVVIMMLGGVTLFIMGMIRVGGYEALQFRYMRAIPQTTFLSNGSTCGYPRADALHIFRSLGADYPWMGTFLRSTIGSLWYWCANQVLVQRTLAAKNMSHAKGGCIFAAYMKFMPFVIIVLPGMISRALYPDEVACADPEVCEQVCANRAGCSNIAYPKLVMALLPLGLRGLMIAVMLAAVISSLTSVFNSSATLFAVDLWAKVRPRAGEWETLLVSKVFVGVLAVLAVLWIPIMQSSQGGEIFKYTTTVTGYLGAPTCAMFVLAIFWNRTTEPGAFWGVLLAQVIGLVRFVLEIIYPAPPCGTPDTRISFIKNFNGYDYTAVQIALAFLAVMVISVLTKPIPYDEYKGLTYWTRFVKPKRDEIWEEQAALTEADTQVVTDTDAVADTQVEADTSAEVDKLVKSDKQKEADSTTKTGPSTFPQEDEGNSNKDVDDKIPDMAIAATKEISVNVTTSKTPAQGVRQIEDYAARLKHLEEPRKLKILTSINAVIVVAVMVALYAFFA